MLNILKLTDACITMLGVLYFVRELLKMAYIIIPIGLIVMLAIDFSKGALSFDDGNKTLSFVLKRVLYAIAIFLIPTIVFGVMQYAGFNFSDSKSCWHYVNGVSVDTVKNLAKLQEEAQNKKNAELEEKLLKKVSKQYNAISKSLNDSRGISSISSSDASDGVNVTGGSKSCKKKQRIRLTSFGDSTLRNAVKKSNLGSTKKGWKTYKYKGKNYLVIATAMENTSFKNPISEYNFKDKDVLTLKIGKKKYDAIVLDVCGACATSTEILKIDLWTTNDRQTWGDYQYLCMG